MMIQTAEAMTLLSQPEEDHSMHMRPLVETDRITVQYNFFVVQYNFLPYNITFYRTI